MATLATYDIVFRRTFVSVKLITFGSPRVGDTNFKFNFQSKLKLMTTFDNWRFVNTNLYEGYVYIIDYLGMISLPLYHLTI